MEKKVAYVHKIACVSKALPCKHSMLCTKDVVSDGTQNCLICDETCHWSLDYNIIIIIRLIITVLIN